jgi:hypothetical protein
MNTSVHNGDGNQGHDASCDDDRSLTDVIKEQPLACLAIAAAAGFVLGGGIRRAGGFTILTLLGQIIMRDAIGEFVTETLGDRHDG